MAHHKYFGGEGHAIRAFDLFSTILSTFTPMSLVFFPNAGEYDHSSTPGRRHAIALPAIQCQPQVLGGHQAQALCWATVTSVSQHLP